jgi:NAD+-dependent protein deacetylase sirtuin 4
MGILGVFMDDQLKFHDDNFAHVVNTTNLIDPELDNTLGSNSICRQQLSIITQNVDTLHRRAGSRHVLELHGRIDQVQCTNCGHSRSRASFHTELETINQQWLHHAIEKTTNIQQAARADGDAAIQGNEDTMYQNIQVPACSECHTGFYKPNVVFFGDSVPAHRVRQCQAAIDPKVCQGLLVIGSSLAVHSAYRHVRSASVQGIPICIVNVGTTRAEVENLSGITKIEAPVGPILATAVTHMSV